MVDLDRRRLFGAGLALAGGSLLAGCQIVAPAAQAPAKLYRIGFLTSDPTQGPQEEAFRQGLHELGYLDGQTITLEERWAQDDTMLPASTHELLQLDVDVIVTGTGPATLAAKSASATIPIVMANTDDPVGSGLVASLSRPGGNVTGLSSYAAQLAPKRLELLKAVVPRLSRVGILWHAPAPSHVASVRETEGAARALGVQPYALELSESDLEGAFDAATREQVDALMSTPAPIFGRERIRLAELALKHRQPLMGNFRHVVASGSLMCYAPDYTDLFRRAATFVDKILKGRQPAELPVELPTTFELVINLKTARALGLTLPQAVLAQATELIQ